METARACWRGLSICFRVLGRNVPFVGRLTFNHGVPWKKAIAETGVVAVLSTISIWVAAIALTFAGLATSPFSGADEVIRNGELYLLASGTVSPLFYITLIRYRPDGDDRWVTAFPHGISYLLCSIAVLATAIVFIAVRSIDASDQVVLPIQLEKFVTASWFVYLFSTFMVFTAAVHKNILEDTTAGVLREEEVRFGDDFRRLRDA